MGYNPITENQIINAIKNLSLGGSAVTPYNPVTLQAKDIVLQGGDLWFNNANIPEEEYSVFNLSSATVTNTLTLSGGSIDGCALSRDGSYVYLSIDNNIQQYLLSVPFDVTSASLNAVYNQTLETGIKAVEISGDGKTLLFGGTNANTIYEVVMSSPHDLSTAAEGSSISIGDVYGLKFSKSGDKLYVLYNNTGLRGYDLSSSFKIATAVQNDNISVPTSRSIAISEQGSMIYLLNNSLNTISRYNLSAPFDISNLGSVVQTLTGLSNVESISMDSFGNIFATRDSGGITLFLDQYNSPTLNVTSTVNPEGGIRSSQGNVTVEVPFSDGFATGVSIATSGVEGCFFNDDGTKYFWCDGINIYENNLSTAYDINTITSTQSFNTNILDPGINLKLAGLAGICATSDGTKVFALADTVANSSNVGIQDDVIRSYTLSTAWDITTASLDAEFVLVGGLIGGTFPNSADITCDGTGSNIYVTGFTGSVNGPITKLNLSTPADLSTASAVQSLPGSTIPSANGVALHVTSDGNSLYIAASTDVYKYDMSSSNDLSTIALQGQLGAGGSVQDGLAISEDESIMIVASGNNSVEYDITETTLAPNPDSFRIGYASEDSPADTNFTALINTIGEVPFTGASVGDTLNLAGSNLQLNGTGSLIGICVKAGFVQILGDE